MFLHHSEFSGLKPRPLEIPHFFLITPGKPTLFVINHWKFHLLFLQYPRKLHILNPRFVFFPKKSMGYSKKKKKNKGRGLMIWNFQGYQRNSMWNFQGLKQSGISKGVQEKIMKNFQWSWFLALGFPRDVTQFCGISKGGALFSLKFPGVK